MQTVKKAWYNKLKRLDRDDGPALVYADGTQEFYINGFLMKRMSPCKLLQKKVKKN